MSEPGEPVRTVAIAGRRALVHVPPDLPGPAPVLLFFHGAGATADWTLAETGWAATADAHGLVLALPEALPIDPSRPEDFTRNPQVWNDGPGRFAFGRRAAADDVGFVRALLDHLRTHFPIDKQRVYAAGFSNVAGMTFRVAAEMADRIAAIASVAGYCWLDDPQPSRPVLTLYLIGTADPLVPLHGGEVYSLWGGQIEQRPPVADTLRKWARAIGCPTKPTLMSIEAGVRVERYTPGPEGAVLLVYVVEGLGHHWPGGRGLLARRLFGPPSRRVNANELIWRFFRDHPAMPSGG